MLLVDRIMVAALIRMVVIAVAAARTYEHYRPEDENKWQYFERFHNILVHIDGGSLLAGGMQASRLQKIRLPLNFT